MTVAPARVRVGAAVLLPGARLLRGPAGEADLPLQGVRLLACLAARAGQTVPWPEAIEAMYAGCIPEADDPRAVAYTRLKEARRALRDTGAGAGVATVHGLGVRLDVPARAAGARVEPRPVSPRQARMVRARDQGTSPADLAERFGLPSAVAASMVVSRARRRLRAEAAPDAGGAP